MKCGKCGSAIEFWIGCQDGVFIDKNGSMFLDRDGDLMDCVLITCSKEGCDWTASKTISKETVEQIALEAGLIENPPVVSHALKNTLGSLCEQNWGGE